LLRKWIIASATAAGPGIGSYRTGTSKWFPVDRAHHRALTKTCFFKKNAALKILQEPYPRSKEMGGGRLIKEERSNLFGFPVRKVGNWKFFRTRQAGIRCYIGYRAYGKKRKVWPT
jgi:hypothetical protein